VGTKIDTKKPIHEEITGKAAALFMQVPRNGLNIVAACLNEEIVIYKIDKTGKLIKNLTQVVDTSTKEPCLNCCSISYDSKSIATGGDDNMVRLY
jgi:hypothetical protein